MFCAVAVLQDSSDPGVVDLYYTMHCLSSEDIEGLPPGGGLPAKYVSVTQTLRISLYRSISA